jgi:hypothetical protein
MGRPEHSSPAHEEETLAKLMEAVGDDIIAFTAGRDDAHLPNAASASVDYSPAERLMFIYKEEGAGKIGPEFVVQNQIAGHGGSLKMYAFRWPERYPSDQTTWGLTVIDNSLPEGERRRSIPGGALKDEDLDRIGELLEKARRMVQRG